MWTFLIPGHKIIMISLMQELNKIIVSHSIIEKSITYQVKIILYSDAQWAKGLSQEVFLPSSIWIEEKKEDNYETVLSNRIKINQETLVKDENTPS